MELTFTGWSRNFGTKTMAKTLLNSGTVNSNRPIYMGETKIRILTPDNDMFLGVEITFGTSMNLGGDHLVNQRFSRRELVFLLNMCDAALARQAKRTLRAVS